MIRRAGGNLAIIAILLPIPGQRQSTTLGQLMITRAWSLPRYDFKASEPNIEKQYFLRSGDVRGKLILYEMLVGLLFHYLHTHYHSPTFYAANSLFSSA